MAVTLELPGELERRLRAKTPELGDDVRQVYAVELFRRGVLSHFELGRMLELDRFETDALLKRYQVSEHGLTHRDVDADVNSLNELLGPAKR